MKRLFAILLLFPLWGFPQTLTIKNQKNKIYRGLNISNLIMKDDTNVVIMNSKIGNADGTGIWLLHCSRVAIKFDTLVNLTSGVYAQLSSDIIVDNNYMLNMHGEMNHDIQFDEVNGGEIMGNHLVNTAGVSSVEDVINIYKSNGTKAAPITITGNWIVGGGPSKSGSGIQLADSGGSWQVAFGNILVNPGQVGIAISGGNHITASNNVVYSKRQTFTNVGICAWNESDKPCNNIVIKNNLVNFINAKGQVNNYWDGENCGAINWQTNRTSSWLNATILPPKL